MEERQEEEDGKRSEAEEEVDTKQDCCSIVPVPSLVPLWIKIK